MDDFFSWHKKLLGRYPDGKQGYHHTFCKLADLNLIILNTCLTSCDKKDEGNLFIIEGNLQEFFDDIDSSNPTFVIGHHGQDFFTPGSKEELGEIFEDENVDLYLCGHSHELGYQSFQNVGRGIHQLTCGGLLAGQGNLSFMYGSYKSEERKACIRSYCYKKNIDNKWEWRPDSSLREQFDGENLLELTLDLTSELTDRKSAPPPSTSKIGADDSNSTKFIKSDTKDDLIKEDWASDFLA
jgi:hypothetical protein